MRSTLLSQVKVPAVFLLVVAGLAILCQSQPASAVPGWAKGTWPPISTNVRTIDGWIVAQGITVQGMENVIAWEVALAPNTNMPISIGHGQATTFVTVGRRQFVVDNATGAVRELRNGRIWRRWAPGGEVAPTVPVTPTPAQPYTPTTPAMPTTPTAPPNASLSRLPAIDVSESIKDPEILAVMRHQQAAADVMTADDRLIDALAALKDARAMRAQGLATDVDVRRAEAAVDLARQEARGSMAKVFAMASVTAAPARLADKIEQANLTPGEREEIRAAQDRLLKLTLRQNQAATHLNKLRDAKASPQAIAAAQATLDSFERAVSSSGRDLNRIRLAAASPDGEISPHMRSRIGQAQQTVMALTTKVAQSQTQLKRVRQAVQTGAATRNELQKSEATLLANIQMLSSASTELNELRSAAYSQTEGGAVYAAPATTQPAE